MTGTEWGEWDALPGENPDDCLRSQNADHDHPDQQRRHRRRRHRRRDHRRRDHRRRHHRRRDHRRRHHRRRDRLRRHHVRRGDPQRHAPRCSSTARPSDSPATPLTQPNPTKPPAPKGRGLTPFLRRRGTRHTGRSALSPNRANVASMSSGAGHPQAGRSHGWRRGEACRVLRTTRRPPRGQVRTADAHVVGVDCGGSRRMCGGTRANGFANGSAENPSALANTVRHQGDRRVASALLRHTNRHLTTLLGRLCSPSQGGGTGSNPVRAAKKVQVRPLDVPRCSGHPGMRVASGRSPVRRSRCVRVMFAETPAADGLVR